MVYKMRLATDYFEKIKSGVKTIECRLYDEKRKELHVGDIIEFIDAQNDKKKPESEIIALLGSLPYRVVRR